MGIEKPNGSGIEHSAPGQNRHGVPFVSGNLPALATHDGVTVYEAHQNGGVRLLQSRLRRTRKHAKAGHEPSGDRPALATHDGVTVYEAHTSGGVRLLQSPLRGIANRANPPETETPLRRLARSRHTRRGNGLRGAQWRRRPPLAVPPSGSPQTAQGLRPSGDVPALATHDGVTVYEAHKNGGAPCSPTYGEAANAQAFDPPATGPLSPHTTG